MGNDVMIDIETLGTDPGSVILSIGAVEFDLKTGKTGEEFYQWIDLESSSNKGFSVSAGTIKWWMMQNKKARQPASPD